MRDGLRTRDMAQPLRRAVTDAKRWKELSVMSAMSDSLDARHGDSML